MNCKSRLAFLASVATIALGVALPSVAFADPVYVFTYTGANVGFAGTFDTLNGSFSIPVSDFVGQPASLPNTDIVALNFTGVSFQPAATVTFTTPYTSIFNPSVYFTYDINGIPQVSYGTGNLGQDPTGNYFVTIGCCNTGFSFPGTYGPVGEQDNQNQWVSSETPLPAALPLFAGGLGASGFLGWRRKRKAVA